MNIRDVNTGTYRPDQLRNGAVGDAAKAETRATTRTGNSAAAPQDRVEISSAVDPGTGDPGTAGDGEPEAPQQQRKA